MSAEAQAPSGVDEVHILWTSEGLSCDGDSKYSVPGVPLGTSWSSSSSTWSTPRITCPTVPLCASHCSESHVE